MAKSKPAKQPSILLEELRLAVPYPLPIKIGDEVVGYVQVAEFSTGSYGFKYNGPISLPIGEKVVKFGLNLNMVVSGSKPTSKAA